jgi:hypothetical protein
MIFEGWNKFTLGSAPMPEAEIGIEETGATVTSRTFAVERVEER